MILTDEEYRKNGIYPDDDTGQNISGQLNMDGTETTEEAAGEDEINESNSPGCLFYSCFACENGHCTALNNNEFPGRPCPFFRARADAKKAQQEAFDHLLMEGRLDLINRYEQVLINLGIEDPEDAKIPIDDDIIAARAEFAEFRQEMANTAESESDEDGGFFWDDDDESDSDNSGGEDSGIEEDHGIQ